MRCAVCGYTAEDGSELLDKAPSSSLRIEYNELHQEFQCSVCTAEIEDMYDGADILPDDQTIIE